MGVQARSRSIPRSASSSASSGPMIPSRSSGSATSSGPDPNGSFYWLFLAVAINFCAQMTGHNVISYYGTRIFKQPLHMPASRAALLNAGVLTWKIVAATSAFLTVDRLGRKPLFMFACAGMSLSMAGLSGTAWAIENGPSRGLGPSVGATFFLFLYMAFFPLGFVGANFLYAAEIAPHALRIHLSCYSASWGPKVSSAMQAGYS